MAETNVEICRRAYAAFASGDMTTLESLMAPDVTWIVAGNNALTGVYTGRQATFSYFGKLLEITEGTLVLTVSDIYEVAPNTLLAMCHVTAQSRGRAVDEDLIQLLEVRDGQAISCRTFNENGYLWDEMVGPSTITLPMEQVRQAPVS